MTADEPEFIFRASSHNAGEHGTSNKRRNNDLGVRLEVKDVSDVFVVLTRSKGLHNVYYWGSAVVVNGCNGVYLITAAHG